MLVASADTIQHIVEQSVGVSNTIAEHAAEGTHAAKEGAPELPTFINFLNETFPHSSWAHLLHQYENQIFVIGIAFGISILAYFASRNKSMIPHALQNAMELAVESLDGLVCGIIGPKGTKYTPFIGTLFLYIFFMNLAGSFPFLKSPTNSWNTTLGLAICVFLYVQGVGIRNNGIGGYFYHLMGSPNDVISWVMTPLMFPLHVLGEFIKPVSLSLRLFGNIFGEDLLVAAFVGMGVIVGNFIHSPIGVPLHFPFLFLQLLTDIVQALVFSLLATIYIFLMLPHEEHAHAEQH
jgi:F-type H+-transporting ATPase subunit a